jgi:hypothetical protein
MTLSILDLQAIRRAVARLVRAEVAYASNTNKGLPMTHIDALTIELTAARESYERTLAKRRGDA